MKKILLLSSLCAMSSFTLADNIGENYEKGGVILGGSASFSGDEYDKWSNLNSNVSFLIADGFSLGLGADRYKIASKTTEDSFSRTSISTTIDYSFGYDPMATTGVAFSVGTSVGYRMYGLNDDTVIHPDMFGGPHFKIDYFLSPRISVYSQISRYTSFDLNPDIIEVEDAIYTSNTLTFGLSYSFANKDITLDNMSK